MKTKHSGFTLIELVVVIGILLALASIVVLFFPSMQEQTRAARGAALLQGWLQVAKTRALRDRAPRGLQIISASQCRYLEQPDDYLGSTSGNTLSTPNDNSTTVNFSMSLAGLAQVGDFLEIGGVGNAYRIMSPPTTTLTLNSPVPYKIAGTTNFRIIRAPRVAGDEVLEMPTDVVIDLGFSKQINIGNLSSAGVPTSIMFSPSGAVVSNQLTFDAICLWVRDVNYPAATLQGEPTLIGAFVRSGLIVAHPVSPSGDYFSFVRDGKSSGK